MREERARTLVLAVLEEAVRRTGAHGVVVAGAGPEGTLLERWLSHGGLPCAVPSPDAVVRSQEVLLATAAGSQASREPWQQGPRMLASMALAREEGLLLLGTANKTTLLLSPYLPLEPILPLGDLMATDILAFQGECSVPACLAGAEREIIREVDRELQEFLEDPGLAAEAFSRIDEPLRSILLEAVKKTGRGWIPRYLVPQIRPPTLGIDLDL